MDWLRSLFDSHGAPSIVTEDTAPARFLDELGTALGRPRAIVVASAHFETDVPTLTGAHYPSTIHDFEGFSGGLDAIEYQPPGAPELADAIADRMRQSGYDVRVDNERGLDHGIWVPLKRMFPAQDIPVVGLSVVRDADAEAHYRLGAALSDLADEEILVIGSGGFVHNPSTMDWRYRETLPFDWAVDFSDWMRECISTDDLARACAWEKYAPHAAMAHPSHEHLMPLFVAWGAAGPHARAYDLHRTWQYGSMALHSFAFR